MKTFEVVLNKQVRVTERYLVQAESKEEASDNWYELIDEQNLKPISKFEKIYDTDTEIYEKASP